MGIFNNKSSNPFLSEERFARQRNQTNNSSEFMVGNSASESTDVMTATGAVNKTILLTGIMLATAAYGFSNPSRLMIIGGSIAAFILVLIAAFRPQTSHITAPAYAALNGLVIGSITSIYAMAYDGIVFQAISATVCIFLAMLMLYRSGLIEVTSKFRRAVIGATLGIALVYVANFVLSMLGINLPYLHQGGPIGIGISLFVIAIGAMNLLLDFDMIERGDAMGAPKYMEWFSGMALLITLVWIYLEILRLLSFLRD